MQKVWETENKFAVSLYGDNIAILAPARVISKDDALNLAAWLVALADTERPHKFLALVEAIQNT